MNTTAFNGNFTPFKPQKNKTRFKVWLPIFFPNQKKAKKKYFSFAQSQNST